MNIHHCAKVWKFCANLMGKGITFLISNFWLYDLGPLVSSSMKCLFSLRKWKHVSVDCYNLEADGSIDRGGGSSCQLPIKKEQDATMAFFLHSGSRFWTGGNLYPEKDLRKGGNLFPSVGPKSGGGCHLIPGDLTLQINKMLPSPLLSATQRSWQIGRRTNCKRKGEIYQ